MTQALARFVLKPGGHIGPYPYQIKRRLSPEPGRMAEIYLASVEATDQALLQGRQVALKIANRPDRLGNFFTNALKNEVQALRSLHHPNIVRLLAIEQAENAQLLFMAQTALANQPWFAVLEYLPHGTLAALLAGQARLPLWVTLEIGYALAATLVYLHRQRLVHLDIKPRNLMLRHPYPLTMTNWAALAGEIVLIDFGSVAPIGQAMPPYQATFLPSVYLAPEWIQAARRGELVVQPGLDLYALGVVLYQMMTGRLPFVAADAFALETAILTAEPLPPSRLLSANERVEPREQALLDRAVLAALHKDPKRRCSADLLVEYLYEARFRLSSPGLYGRGAIPSESIGGEGNRGEGNGEINRAAPCQSRRLGRGWGVGALLFLAGVGVGGATATPLAATWSNARLATTPTPIATLQPTHLSPAIATVTPSTTPTLPATPTLEN